MGKNGKDFGEDCLPYISARKNKNFKQCTKAVSFAYNTKSKPSNIAFSKAVVDFNGYIIPIWLYLYPSCQFVCKRFSIQMLSNGEKSRQKFCENLCVFYHI